jgi:hypothetical protein
MGKTLKSLQLWNSFTREILQANSIVGEARGHPFCNSELKTSVGRLAILLAIETANKDPLSNCSHVAKLGNLIASGQNRIILNVHPIW